MSPPRKYVLITEGRSDRTIPPKKDNSGKPPGANPSRENPANKATKPDKEGALSNHRPS